MHMDWAGTHHNKLSINKLNGVAYRLEIRKDCLSEQLMNVIAKNYFIVHFECPSSSTEPAAHVHKLL